MAQENNQGTPHQHGDNPRLNELIREHGEVGRGLDSPDSTQAPLDATTGEPDKRVQEGGSSGQSGQGA
ncbi:MAG: hypothetical protein JO040_01000 [Gemmatimonadetes bacterium]|nr:hypothetical protein [Gemmatimonadota bacterium]